MRINIAFSKLTGPYDDCTYLLFCTLSLKVTHTEMISTVWLLPAGELKVTFPCICKGVLWVGSPFPKVENE